MTIFVILHYLALQSTVSEIDHILYNLDGNKKIIVIDNGSPNGSGVKLRDKYGNNNNVHVILNPSNVGFAQGMNIGYKAALQLSPQFIVLLNNDIEFLQNNFIDRVNQSYQRQQFAVLGPDVEVPETHVHQNPKKISSYTVPEVTKINVRNKKIMNLGPELFAIRAKMKSIPILKKIVLKLRGKKKDFKKNNLNNIVLHGSILIFSKDFFQKFDEPFVPETFFYFETEILDRRLKEKRLISKYDSSIKVFHHQSSSTKQSFSSLVDRQRFQTSNMVKSTGVFLKLFRGK